MGGGLLGLAASALGLIWLGWRALRKEKIARAWVWALALLYVASMILALSSFVTVESRLSTG